MPPICISPSSHLAHPLTLNQPIMSAAVHAAPAYAHVYSSSSSKYSTPVPSSRRSSVVEATKHSFRLPRSLPVQPIPPVDLAQFAKADPKIAQMTPREISCHLDGLRTG